MSSHEHPWQDLEILLAQFPKEGLTIDTVLPPDWLKAALYEQDGDVYHPTSEGCPLNMEVRREVDGFRVMGTVHFTVSYRCGRCLEVLEQEFEVSIDTLFLPAKKYAETGKTLREVEEEMEVHLHNEEKIDLMQMLSEEVLLALPLMPVVETDEKDRCVICGKTMADFFKESPVEEEPVDPRWAKLKQLKENNS